MRTGLAARRGSTAARDRGATSVELLFYAPILFFLVFVTVQAGMVYLGNQAATSVARESARVARTQGADTPEQRAAAEQRGLDYARGVAHGYLSGVTVDVVVLGPAGDRTVRATVEAESYALVPAFGGHITRSVEGPVEEFRPDT